MKTNSKKVVFRRDAGEIIHVVDELNHDVFIRGMIVKPLVENVEEANRVIDFLNELKQTGVGYHE